MQDELAKLKIDYNDGTKIPRTIVVHPYHPPSWVSMLRTR
jgi:hypothetical protein